jgi:hypothetical protein
MTQTETEAPTRTETFDCHGPAELVVATESGRIDVRLTDVPHVRVQVSVERGESPSWEQGVEGFLDRVSAGRYDPDDADAHFVREAKIGFSEQRRRLVVRTPRTFRRSRLTIVIEAPQGSRVTTRTHVGPVNVSGALSALNAATGSGDVTTDQIEGKADVRTGKGDIKLGRVAGRLRAKSGSGELEVASIEGEGATLATGNGDVWLGVVRADVQVRTGRGSVTVAEAGSGRVDLVTGSGDVFAAIRPGVAAEVDLVSGSGRARSELSVADQPPRTAPLLRVRARTGSGDVLVQSADA